MIRIGCLGAARVAPSALILPAKDRGDVVLQAIAARDPKRAKAFADDHGFFETHETYASVIAAANVDLVYIPLPINLHAEWSIRALEAGKHVLCEKPLAMNSSEAARMQAAARASGRRLIEALPYRYHPGFAQMLRWLADGEIGTLRRIEAHFDLAVAERHGEIRHAPDHGGGAFMDQGCLPLSWALTIAARAPERIEAEAKLTRRGVDETMRAKLHFSDGLTAVLSASMAPNAPFSAMLRVTGAAGEIVYLNPQAPQFGAALVMTRNGERIEARVGRRAAYSYQVDAVVEAIASGAALPTEGEAILLQQRALDGVYAAAGLAHLRQTHAPGGPPHPNTAGRASS
jgi:predicted dehydrogenase